MKDKFIEINTYYEPGLLLQKLNEGYEIVTQYQSSLTEYTNLHGSLMNNSLTIESAPISKPYTVFILKQPPAAQVLYGKQDT